MTRNMRQRQIFVSYVAWRKCRYNPSMDRFKNLPAMEQDRLLDALHKRSLAMKRVRK
jgi:hypothetical protein